MTGPWCDEGLFLGVSAGRPGDTGRYDESEPLAEGVAELVLARSACSWYAVGGRLKVDTAVVPSLPRMSLDEPGVGGGLGRGIIDTTGLADGTASGAGLRAWNMAWA